VLVVCREGRAGDAALREAAELAAGGAALVVVSLAPQSSTAKCCKGNGAGPYNCAIRDLSREELDHAREVLGTLAGRASYKTLMGTPQPPLGEWSAGEAFDTALVPRERLTRGGGRAARELRPVVGDVRLVG
jgi:hypothetical protein